MERGTAALYARYAGSAIDIIILSILLLAELQLKSTAAFSHMLDQEPYLFAGIFFAGFILLAYGMMSIIILRKEAIGRVFVIDHRDPDNAGIAYYKGLKLRIASTGLLDPGDQVRITGTQSASLSGFGVLFIGVKI